MTKTLFLLVFVFLARPFLAASQELSIFPQESAHDLILVSADAKSSSFIVINSNGEQIKGYFGDFLGLEELKVTEVTDDHVTLETVEHFIDKDGNQREQRSRMQLPVSVSLDGQGKGARR